MSVIGDGRPSFSILLMDFAKGLARRSTCRRLHVGCVISSVDHRQVFSVGYNGNASGLANDCDRHGPDAVGNCGCLHAEENAVINCTAPRDAPKFVFCTNQPCLMCAKRLVNLGGVKRVYFDEPYRLTDGLDVFDRVGVECVKLVRP